MTMKKQMTISAVIIAVVLTMVVFSYGNLAVAEEISLVYPTNGYLQAENVDSIGVNQSYIVTADNENKIISYTGDACGNLDFGTFNDNAVKIFVFGDTAVIKGENAFYTTHLDSDNVTIEKTDLFNDCYFATDGTSLFVHKSGKVDVYDDSLALTTTYENKIFNGTPVITASSNTIYSFAVDYEFDFLHIFDTASQQAESILHTRVYNAIIGKVIYAHNGKNIILIDPENYEIVDTALTEQNYTAFGECVYIAKGSEGYDKYAYADGALTLVGNHSYTGNTLDRLNTPSSSIMLGDTLIITDTLNDRLLYVGASVDSLSLNKPTAIAEGNGKLYVATADGITIVENKTVVGTIKTNLSIIDIFYSDGMYVLAKDGVYLNIIGSLHKIFDVNNARAIYVDELYYILTDAQVVVARSTSLGLEKTDLLSFNTSGYTPVDVLADKVGNVYVLGDDNTIHCYKWQDVIASSIDGSAPLSTDVPLESKAYNFTVKSMAEMGDKIVITTEENALISVSNPMTKSKQAPSSIDTENTTVGTYISTEKTYFMTNDNDGKTAVKIGAGLTFVCYEIDGLLYTSFEGKKGFVANVNSVTASTACAGEYVAKDTIKLYANPMTDDGIVVSQGTSINVVDNGGFDDESWVRVEYNGKAYYTQMSGLEKKTSSKPAPAPQTPELPEKVSKDYGRAKSSRAGELVSLFSVADSNVVVARVTDGTRLEVVEKIGDFYKVKYDEGEVLIHKDQFKLDGLTTVQIIAIVLSVVVVLAGGLIFMVTSLSKKKEENQ